MRSIFVSILFVVVCLSCTPLTGKTDQNLARWGGVGGCGACLVNALGDSKLKWCVLNQGGDEAFRGCLDPTAVGDVYASACNDNAKGTLYTAAEGCEAIKHPNVKSAKYPTTGGECEKCFAAKQTDSSLKWCAKNDAVGSCKASCDTGETEKTTKEDCPKGFLLTAYRCNICGRYKRAFSSSTLRWCVVDEPKKFYACVDTAVTSGYPSECEGDKLVDPDDTTCTTGIVDTNRRRNLNLELWGGRDGCGGCLTRAALNEPWMKWCVLKEGGNEAFRDCLDSTAGDVYATACNDNAKGTWYTAAGGCEAIKYPNVKSAKYPTIGEDCEKEGECEKCIAARQSGTSLKWCATNNGGSCKASCDSGETEKTTYKGCTGDDSSEWLDTEWM